MTLSNSVPSTMPPNEERGQEERWSDNESEDEVWTDPSNKVCEEINSTQDGKELTKNGEVRFDKPKEGMKFDTLDDAYLHYCGYAKESGFAVSKRTCRKGKDGKLRDVTLSCSRGGKQAGRTSNPLKPRPQSRINCPARIRVLIHLDGMCTLNKVVLDHNHANSPGNRRYLKSNRVLDEHVKRKLELSDKAGIQLHKTYDSLQIEAGGPDKLPFLEKDCRNYLDKQRRLRLVQGDAEAMHSYFIKMKEDNADFFYAMDFDCEGRLQNVFWADARSRAACKEFGDVVTFDTTYLVNKYHMPFAPFVGVNHHGQSTLLGCGLISKEDTESFSWLFQTWKTCMWGCPPEAIITDQCLAMKNAIEIVFPTTRHRWCIWHIMKKLPEKFSGYNAYKRISWSMRAAVYDSLTTEQFEDAWAVFIKKYELQNSTWLEGLYLERKRWVPAYLKDRFWAGMSSTQRSESVNAYFDGYINSKTTLKQFVEQYENALANKVEKEKQEDWKNSTTFVPCIRKDELEKQFQSAYTLEKVKEFQDQFVAKLDCRCVKTKEGDIISEYVVKQYVTFGEGEEEYRKEVSFTVKFNAETKEAHCNCRLFEFKGMVCCHQLMVWHETGVQRVPDKYVFKRWCKNIKRVHTKVRICYDKSPKSSNVCRHEKMCNFFNEVADLAEQSDEMCDTVMRRLRELKQELVEASVMVDSNVASLVDGTDTQGQDSFLHGDGTSIPILDPVCLRRKGRPPTKRKIGVVEKAIAKKRQTKKKSLSNKNSKDVEENAVGHYFGSQESIVHLNDDSSYMGHTMWQNMMPYSMPPPMAQGGSIFPFSPPLGPIGTSFNQFMPSFSSSQSILSDQAWMSQPTNMGSQVLGGGQSSFMEMMNESDKNED